MMAPRFSLREFGPGLVIAATGLGAGDLVVAAVAGARYGTVLLWAVLLGALMKFAMNEGLARWQLATGSTLLEGWIERLPQPVSLYFLVYLLVWSFVVAGALLAATGLAAHALYPGLSVTQWGVIHSLLATALVLSGRYRLLEPLMKLFMVIMMLVVLVCAALIVPELADMPAVSWLPAIPPGSVLFIVGLIGGIGGSVTVLCYGYWMQERGWTTPAHLGHVRRDLAMAYTLTGLFGLAIMVIAAGVQPDEVTGARMALVVAARLETVIGPFGKWCFLVGFWSAVFSSMLGVWQGVPYLFADYVRRCFRHSNVHSPVDTRSSAYRGYLFYLAIPPMVLLLADKPVWLVLVYAVAGAFFMPLLGILLLVMNNRRTWTGELGNGIAANLILFSTVLLFGLLLLDTLRQTFD
ncbi:MAG: Nramp family divalent metal transporter [Pseudomonadota bacterium]